MFITSFEVAELRSDFNALDSDLTLLKATYENHPEITLYIIRDAPATEEFASSEDMISELLSKVNEREVAVMDVNDLKELAAHQTRQYDHLRSLFKVKTEHLRAVRLGIEKEYKTKGLDNAKFKFIGEESPNSLAKDVNLTAVANPAKRRADTEPITPPNKRKQAVRFASARSVRFSQHSPPTSKMSQANGIGDFSSNSTSPLNSQLLNAPITTNTPSPLNKGPVLTTWSTQSPLKQAEQLSTESELAQSTEPEPTMPPRTHPPRQLKPSPKGLANITQSNRRTNVTKTFSTPSRQNPKRVAKSISYNIANMNCETVRLSPGAELGTFSLLQHPNSTQKNPRSTAQHIWEMRYPNANISVPAPDLSNGLSADGLKDEIKNFVTRSLKKVSDRHPEENDEINRLVGVLDGYLERNKMLVARDIVTTKHYDPTITEKFEQLTQEAKAAKEDAALSKKDLDRNQVTMNLREKRIEAQNKEIAALEETLQARNNTIDIFENEEKYYGMLLEENDQLKATMHNLEVDSMKCRHLVVKEASNEGEIVFLKDSLDVSSTLNAKLQQQMLEYEQITGNTMEELLAITRRMQAKKMAARNEEEYIDGLVNDLELYKNGPNEPSPLARRFSA